MDKLVDSGIICAHCVSPASEVRDDSDDQTSSNSPGHSAGDGSSGRGYLDVISETVVGFIGDLTCCQKDARPKTTVVS